MNELGKLSLSLGFEDLEPSLASLHLEEGIYLLPEEVMANWLLKDQPCFDEDDLSSVHVDLHLHACASSNMQLMPQIFVLDSAVHVEHRTSV